MQRSLIQLSKKTLVVSLPSPWIEAHKLKKGDVVEVRTSPSQVTISTSRPEAPSEHVIDISGLPSNIIYHLVNARYRAGAERITILFNNSKVLNTRTGEYIPTLSFLQRIAEERTGLEIIEYAPNKCVFQEVSKAKADELPAVTRRTFHALSQMMADTLTGLEKKDIPLLEQVSLYAESHINRLTHFCMRLLSQYGKETTAITSAWFSVIQNLEEIGDTLDLLAKTRPLCSLGVKEKSFFNETKKLFVSFQKACLSERPEDIRSFYREWHELYQPLKAYERTAARNALFVVSSLKKTVKLMLESINMLEVAQSSLAGYLERNA